MSRAGKVALRRQKALKFLRIRPPQPHPGEPCGPWEPVRGITFRGHCRVPDFAFCRCGRIRDLT